MKIRYIILILVALLVLAGCKKRDDLPENGKTGNYLIHASTQLSDTKVDAVGTTTKWQMDDVLYVCEIIDGTYYSNPMEFSIVSSSISFDGKNADFTGPQLTAGKKYRAFSCSLGGAKGNQGAVVFEDLTTIFGNVPLFMSSAELTIGSTEPIFVLDNEMSIIELEVKLSDTFGQTTHVLDAVSAFHISNPFVKHFSFRPYERSVKESSGAANLVLKEYKNVVLSNNRTIKIRIPICWNEELTQIDGNYEFSFKTSENLVATVTKPAKVLKKGTIYTAQIEIDKFEDIATIERNTLIAIYNEMGGANWKNNQNWCTDLPVDQWGGVAVNNVGRVNFLTLYYQNSDPVTISEKLFTLEQLELLEIEANVLSVPSSIGKLQKLEYLTINRIAVCGQVAPNRLTDLPEELSTLSRLKRLAIQAMPLRSIPDWLQKLDKMEYLNISHSDMTGEFPEWVVSQLDKLKNFTIVGNKLSGELPLSLIYHDKWAKLAKNILVGNNFDREGLEYSFAHDSYIDILTNELVDTKQIVQNNKLTIFFRWWSECPYSSDFVLELKRIVQNFKSQNVGVITYDCFDAQNQIDIAKAYVTQNQMEEWTNLLGYIHSLCPSTMPLASPFVSIVDQNNKIIFDEDLTSPTHTWMALEQFLNDYFNITPPPVYESTDFSADGQVTKLYSATKGNGVNLVLMGDGFVDRDMAAGGKYEQRMNEALRHLFSVEPMKSYKEYFNVYSVKAVSVNEGAGEGRSTKFSTHYGKGTFVGGNLDDVLACADNVQGVDLTQSPILVVLNSSKYAGTCHTLITGESIAFCPYIGNSTTSFGEVVHHEMIGHGFGRLLDEYIYNYGTITPDYVKQFNESRTLFDMGWNMTLSLNNVPWKHFFNEPSYSMVGTYEGGYFFSRGVWRAEQNSCMNNNVPYFNGPSRELIVKRIKQIAGENYSFADFKAKDKYEPVMSTRSMVDFVPFAPTVLVKATPKYKR